MDTDAPTARRFAYCRDGVYLAAVAIYFCNRWLLKPSSLLAHSAFVHNWLNDVLCLPFLLPPVLYLHRRLGLRRSDSYPSWVEIGFHFAAWSVCFESIAPSLPAMFPRATPDPWDVAAYAAGALVAGLLWRSPLTGRPISPPSGMTPLLGKPRPAGFFIWAAQRVRLTSTR